jgi:hypothetical protein
MTVLKLLKCGRQLLHTDAIRLTIQTQLGLAGSSSNELNAS